MRSVQDIRRTLEDRAGGIPDGDAVVRRAQARAEQLGRRRRIGRSVAAAVAVAVVAVGAPLALRQGGDSAPAISAVPPYRTPSQLTLSLAPDSGFALISRGSVDVRQFAHVRNARALRADRPDLVAGNSGADVWAFDPGTYDPAALQRGEPVTVSGRQAWFVPDLTIAGTGMTEGGPAVGWQADPGVWVIVYDARMRPNTRADLIEVARSIRLEPPREVPAPFQFGWIPEDLPVSYVTLANQSLLSPHVFVGFGQGGRTIPGVAPVDMPLSVTALPASSTDPDPAPVGLPAPTRIGGYDTWYLPRPNEQFTGAPTGADMIVEAGNCTIHLHTVDRARVTAEDFTRLVENATFSSCTKPATWLPLLR